MHETRKLLTYGFCRESGLEISLDIPNDIKHLVLLYNTKYHIIACGQNYGALSLDKPLSNKFTELVELENIMTNFYNININYRSMMVIDEFHNIYVVGCNNWDRLGTKNGTDWGMDKSIDHFEKIKFNEQAILTSKGISNSIHTFIYTSSDKLYGNGSNYDGRLGNGIKELDEARASIKLLPIPKFWNNNETIINIKCGNSHSIFLTNNNNVYSCGSNRECQCLMDNNIKCIAKPKLIYNNIKQIDVGDYMSLLLQINGDLIILGSFGDNNINFANEIVSNFKNKSITIKEICSGYYHGLALTVNNKCYSYGNNFNGQCGSGEKSGLSEVITDPYLILFNNEYVQQIACGFRHSIVLTNKNNLYSFGSNMSKECSPYVKDNSILSPYYLDKEKELKIDKTSYIEYIAATSDGASIIVINPNVIL
eukprot:16108_1